MLISKLIVPAVLMVGLTIQPAATSQTPQTQSQPTPCVTASPTTQNSNTPNVKLSEDAKRKVEQKRQWLQKYSPIQLPDPTAVTQKSKQAPPPCPPAQTNAQPTPVMHVPLGVTTIWLCNPIVISTDPSHTTTFITPDALTNAEPAQSSAFEADGAKADPKAAMSCANLRRDPKNNRVFLAQ